MESKSFRPAELGTFGIWHFFFNNKKWFFAFFIKLIWLGVGFLNMTCAEIQYWLEKKSTQIIFYFWKMSKIPQLPSSAARPGNFTRLRPVLKTFQPAPNSFFKIGKERVRSDLRRLKNRRLNLCRKARSLNSTNSGAATGRELESGARQELTKFWLFPIRGFNSIQFNSLFQFAQSNTIFTVFHFIYVINIL